MTRESILNAQGAFEILDTYQSHRIKEAVAALREAFEPIIENEKKKGLRGKQNMNVVNDSFDPLRDGQKIIQVFNNSIQAYETASINLEKAHKSTQDILHAIELLDLSEEEMIQMARDLHEVRRIRRESKDLTEVMLPLYDLAFKYQHITEEFKAAVSEMHRITKQKEKRIYTVRERVDLAEKFERIAQ